MIKLRNGKHKVSLSEKCFFNKSILELLPYILFFQLLIISLFQFLYTPESKIYDPYIHYSIQLKLSIKSFFEGNGFNLVLADRYTPFKGSFEKRFMFPLIIALLMFILPFSATTIGILVSLIFSVLIFYKIKNLLLLYFNEEVSNYLRYMFLISSTFVRLYANISHELGGFLFFIIAISNYESFKKTGKKGDLSNAILAGIVASCFRESYILVILTYGVVFSFRNYKKAFIITLTLITLLLPFYIVPITNLFLPDRSIFSEVAQLMSSFNVLGAISKLIRFKQFKYERFNGAPAYLAYIITFGHILLSILILFYYDQKRHGFRQVLSNYVEFISENIEIYFYFIIHNLFLFLVQFPLMFDRYIIAQIVPIILFLGFQISQKDRLNKEKIFALSSGFLISVLIIIVRTI